MREEGEGGRASERFLALRTDAGIKLAEGPKTTKLHMLRSERGDQSQHSLYMNSFSLHVCVCVCVCVCPPA